MENTVNCPNPCKTLQRPKSDGVSPNTLYSKANIRLNLTLNDLGKLVLFRFGSLANFGKRIGVTRGYVSHILRGDQTLTNPSIVQKWADVLEVNVIILAQLLSGGSK